MTLLTIDEIQVGLDREFLPLEPMLCGFRLVQKSVPNQLVEDVENKLLVSLPKEFRDLILAFDFGQLTIGPVAFCATGDYFSELFQLNTQVNWWRGEQRPEGLLMVANSDPFAILLDLKTGAVLAMDAEIGYEKSVRIARNFRDFLLGIGTLMLMRNVSNDRQDLARTVSSDVGSVDLEFWLGLASP